LHQKNIESFRLNYFGHNLKICDISLVTHVRKSEIFRDMLLKNPKSNTRKWIKRGAVILFAGEAVAFAVSYGIWYGVNTKREYRKYLHDNYPSFLELYYKVGETIDSDCKIRQIDYSYWEAKKH
jgi:hypothetical protein